MKKGQNPKGEEMLGVTLGSNQYLNRLEEEISKVDRSSLEMVGSNLQGLGA